MTPFAKNALQFVDDRWIDWTTWKYRWRNAGNNQDCLALLHYGFKTRVENTDEEAERLSFYLRLTAGKWVQSARFPAEGSLTRKALNVLAIQLSKEDVLNRRLPFLPPATLVEVMRFFRIGEYEIFNDTKRGFLSFKLVSEKDKSAEHAGGHHDNERISAALYAWCINLWCAEFEHHASTRHSPNPRTLRYLRLMRPSVITLLEAYGALEKLIEPMYLPDDEVAMPLKLNRRVHWELFDEPCMRRLETLALLRGHTLHDALLAGSSAAKVWFLVQAAQGRKNAP